MIYLLYSKLQLDDPDLLAHYTQPSQQKKEEEFESQLIYGHLLKSQKHLIKQVMLQSLYHA